jgi:hypothetical protein
MKFVKLLIKGEPQWRLCLENVNDINFYFEIEPERMFMDYLDMCEEKHPMEGRQKGIARVLDARIGAANEGEKIHPIIEVAKICDAKWAGMLRYIDKDTICVNEVGGWCGLKGFIETWNAEILEERVATNIGFPIDVTRAKTLVLENNSYVSKQVLKYIKNNGIEDCAQITLLKEKDTAMVIESIKNAETIIIESEFLDSKQVYSFLSLFLKIEPKNFVIFGNIENLMKYELFKENRLKHNIIFNNVTI